MTNLHSYVSRSAQQISQKPTSSPSGIAQLRQSIDASVNTPQPDAMNLDDLIFPASIATPMETSPSPAPDSKNTSTTNTATAIPIKTKKKQEHIGFPPASAPVPPQDRFRGREFDYVRKHVRKTSIDERNVGVRIVQYLESTVLTSQRHVNDQPNHRLKFLPSTASLYLMIPTMT